MKQPQQRDEFIRKRMERQRRIRKRRLVLSLIFLILIMLAVGVTLSLTVFFPIQTINASGSEIYPEDQIVASTGIKKGDNLFTFSEKDAEQTLRTALPYIENVQIKRHLPGTLDITVSDAVEYACYSVDGKYYTVSESGYVLNSYDAVPENVFEVKCSDIKCNIGSKIEFTDDKTEKLMNKIIDGLSDKEISINYIDISDSVNITAKIDGRFIVAFGTSNYFDKKLNHLSGMLKNIDAAKTGKIDLSMWTTSHTEGTFVEENIN